MKIDIERNKVFILLALVLAMAFGLRIWGIWFGLPFSYRADEYHEVFRALELGSGGFNLDRTGKGGYFYVLFVEYGLLFVALKLAGIVDTVQDFARYFARDLSSFYLLGRATTAIIGTVTVFLTYRLGARAYSTAAGILAALILAVDFLSVEHSHFVTVDMPMTCLATATLIFAVRIAMEGRPGDYKWAALLAALATTTKLPGILLLLPLLIAHGHIARRHGGGARHFFASRDLWWAAAIFVVVLAVTNPGIFVNPPLPAMFGFAGVAETGYDDEALEEIGLLVPRNLFVYYISVLGESMGWPLLIISLAGVLYALWRRTIVDVLLVSFAFVFYIVFSSTDSHLYYPRYMLPLIVVLSLLAGRLLAIAWPANGRGKQLIAACVVASLVFLPAYRSIGNNYLLTRMDTRTIAKEWFEDNIPAGSRVVIEGQKIEPTRLTVPLQDTAENMRGNIRYYKSREPGKAKYLDFKLQVQDGKSYDLMYVTQKSLQPLEVYKNAGEQYVVVRPEALALSRKVGLEGPDFLQALRNDPQVSLLKRFESDPATRPGPDIEIYRIEPNTAADEVAAATENEPAPQISR